MAKLRARAAKDGKVRVIVGYWVPFAPEAELDAAERAEQNAAAPRRGYLLLARPAGRVWNVASTTPPARRESVQVGEVPVQEPLQFRNSPFGPGWAVNITCVPAGWLMVQLMAQLVGLPFTVAVMVPGPIFI